MGRWYLKQKYIIAKLPIEWLEDQEEFLEAIGSLGGPHKDIDFCLMEDLLNLEDPDFIKVRIGASTGIIQSIKSSGKITVKGKSWDIEFVEDVEKE